MEFKNHNPSFPQNDYNTYILTYNFFAQNPIESFRVLGSIKYATIFDGVAHTAALIDCYGPTNECQHDEFVINARFGLRLVNTQCSLDIIYPD